MRKLIQLLIFIIIFQGCSDGSSEKVLQMEDIAPKAKNTLNKVNDPLKTKPIIGFSTVAAQWVGFKLDSIVPVDSLFFNDRFYPKKSVKYKLYQAASETMFTQWVFKDSSATFNAFYNWLDCYGEACKSITIGQKKALQKDNCVILVNDTSLTYITSKEPVKMKQWFTYFDTLTHSPNWKFIVCQDRKKTTWNAMKDRVLQPIKK
ncbi:MAG: hypothetical protein KA521_10140 [Crocinitomicaceae bacterium]|nr:hypothetical protein [Crocinitomicaceae bacterium]